MKVKVNENCIGCGACTATAEGVFEFGDEGLAKAVVEEVPEDKKEDAKAAAEGCPVQAIEVTEE